MEKQKYLKTGTAWAKKSEKKVKRSQNSINEVNE